MATWLWLSTFEREMQIEMGVSFARFLGYLFRLL